ncbi:monovalent cation/H+ antiporter subunit D family protein [Streptomyces otsuchiensis]|uniref:monovalent cation/H+ antiporter subunit D family protein n=1 Tax=Streptomyces otsuchiensis TaxID=2681388 RepID=UPI0010308565|nr:monovalent cation/H+ antiporter subunit D family protein [Streptomyces otsuchiensis]
MTTALIALPIAAPMLAAGSIIAASRYRRICRLVVQAVSAAVLVIAGVLIAQTADGSVVTMQVGDWAPGVAVVFAVDMFSALMLAVSSLLVLVCYTFATAAGDDAEPLFGPLVLILSAGVYGTFITADLFNLFVLIEVMLLPSYALLIMAGSKAKLAAGRIYLLVNLLASTVFLAGLAMLYAVAGTLNMGALAGAASENATVAAAGAVILVAMAAKAAMVPLHGWLPRTYPEASPAVTALFSGLLTKTGAYVIIRVYSTLYDGDERYVWVIMAGAMLTMVIGVLAAVGQDTLRSILAFDMVSQIGYVLLGLALATHAGLAATVFFLVQYALVKAALLLCAGAVESAYGTGRLSMLGGLAGRERLLAAAYAVAALSLAGLPPMSGFVAKLGLIRAAVLDEQYLPAAVAVVVSLLTLLPLLKIWTGAFAGALPGPLPDTTRTRPALVAPAVVLAAVTIALGIGAQPLLSAAETAADILSNPTIWAEAVRGG